LPVGSSANRTVGRAISARDRDALLLAARQLGRLVVAPLAQPHALEQRVDVLRPRLRARNRERQRDVLLSRQRRQQVERLEDEADLAAAQLGQPAIPHRGDLLAAHVHGAGARAVKPGEQMHQRRLAQPDGPITAVNWPAGTSSETPRRASTADSPSP
jgi:hypothetical protein